MKLIFQSIILAGAVFLILFASMLVIGYLQTFSSTPAPIADDVITLQNLSNEKIVQLFISR